MQDRITKFDEFRGCYVIRPDGPQGQHIQKLGKYEDLEERIDDIKEAMCDHYCKFPEEYFKKEEYDDAMKDAMWETMQEEKCENCPLNGLDVNSTKFIKLKDAV